MDVLEDRLFLENPKVYERTVGYDPEKHWFAHAGWNYQCSPERQANIYLDAEDTPNFLRSFLNQYAVDLFPSRATFSTSTRHADRPTRSTKKPPSWSGSAICL